MRKLETILIEKGGFADSITSKQADTLGVCNGVSDTWKASRG